MKRERCKQNLIPYLEKSLKGTELQEMEHHLEECASCRGFADYMRATLFSVENSRVTIPDPYFYTRVKAKIDKQEESFLLKPGFARILQPAMLTLLLIAAVFVGVEIGSSGPDSGKENYAMENLDPWMNELGSEPLETFLMD